MSEKVKYLEELHFQSTSDRPSSFLGLYRLLERRRPDGQTTVKAFRRHLVERASALAVKLGDVRLERTEIFFQAPLQSEK